MTQAEEVAKADKPHRVLRLGAGVQISKRSSPDRIANAVTEVIGGEQYGAAARHFADVLAREADSTERCRRG